MTPSARPQETPGRAASLARLLLNPLQLPGQLGRYALASALSLSLDSGVYLVLLRAGLNAVLAGVIGYGAGASLHYALSRRFVFVARGADKSHIRLAAEFVVSGLVGLWVTAATIALCTGYFGASPIAGKAVAIAVSFIVVFAVRRQIVFQASRGARAACERAQYARKP
ncbi:MAG: GtrA family protein [Alphaproteobacteria bacterium]|nr:GtrA family protein [Alphaproteobacteria bacterium]